MPTKHIDQKTWTIVEKATVELVKKHNRPFKTAEVLNLLVNEGFTKISAGNRTKVRVSQNPELKEKA